MSLVAAIVVTAFGLLAACGVDQDPHFDENAKTFGQADLADLSPSSDDLTGPIRPTKSQESAEGNDEPGEIDLGEGVADQTEIDPESVTLQNHYRTFFDYNEIYRLRDGLAPDVPSNIVRNTIISSLPQSDENELLLVATFGDGVGRSRGDQYLTNTSADANTPEGQVSTSGLLVYDRVTGEARGRCGRAFVCADRMRFTPDQGGALTVCFYDMDTDDVIAIPYAAAPNHPKDDFVEDVGDFGMVIARRYDSEAVDCQTPGRLPDAEAAVTFTTSLIPDNEVAATPTLPGARRLDFGVRIEVSKVVGNATRPYIDELTRLQVRTDYFLNEEESLLVKFVKTGRSGVDRILLDGVQIDLSFDLCQNQLDSNDPDICE